MMELGSGAALAPCTCGELVQGTERGVPFLVSCPIDLYSRVRAVLHSPDDAPGPDRRTRHRAPGTVAGQPTKAMEAARGTLRRLGRGDLQVRLEVACPLPPSRGFGTSTADIVAAVTATAAALGVRLDPAEVAEIAVGVEPSDSTMFPGLALFDHRQGSRWEPLGTAPPLLVAVLGFDGTVDTVDYNARLNPGLLMSLESEHERALSMLRKGLAEGRMDLMGEAATLSARLNQTLLPKQQLEGVVDLAAGHGALGVCAAHSGTALGVLFPAAEFGKAEKFLATALQRFDPLTNYWVSRVVGGGARRVGEELARAPRPLVARR